MKLLLALVVVAASQASFQTVSGLNIPTPFGIIGNLRNALETTATDISNLAKNINPFNDEANNSTDIISGITSNIATGISNLAKNINPFNDQPNNNTDLISSMTSNIETGISNLVKNIIPFNNQPINATGLIGGIISAVDKALGNVSGGPNIIRNILRGNTTSINEIMNKIRSMGNDLKNEVGSYVANRVLSSLEAASAVFINIQQSISTNNFSIRDIIRLIIVYVCVNVFTKFLGNDLNF